MMHFLVRSIILCAALIGCAAPNPKALQYSLEAGNCANTTHLLEQERGKYGGNSELLFLMDAGMVHLQCGNYALAQEHFHNAEQLADALWPKVSVVRQAHFLPAITFSNTRGKTMSGL